MMINPMENRNFATPLDGNGLEQRQYIAKIRARENLLRKGVEEDRWTETFLLVSKR